jgi:uncharacterized protein (TIGR00255 family)
MRALTLKKGAQMARSMTAFANADSLGPLGQLRFELRSVNHRFLELGFKLPEELRALEPLLREQAQKVIQRGKVDVSLRFKAPPQTEALALNQPLVEGLLALADALHNRHPELKPLSTADVLAWPGAVQSTEHDVEALKKIAVSTFREGLAEFDLARAREGDKLTQTLREKLAQLGALREQALTLLPHIKNGLHEKLTARLAEFKDAVEPSRLEAELVLNLHKLDVDEELERLRIHLLEGERVLSLSEPVGRRLDFLVQELHRECNTFGAKSVDARTSQLGVDMKVLVEQVREQVQNLE